MRPLIVILLLSGCVIEQGGASEALRVEVSRYPTRVSPGTEFSVVVDVLEVQGQLETDVTRDEGVVVAERVGSSFVILNITVLRDAAGFQEITVGLRDGLRSGIVKIGFSVLENDV